MKKFFLILVFITSQFISAGSGWKLFVTGSRAHSSVDQLRESIFTTFLSKHLQEAILTKGPSSCERMKEDLPDKIVMLLIASIESPSSTLKLNAARKFINGNPSLRDCIALAKGSFDVVAIKNLNNSLEKNVKESLILENIKKDVEYIGRAYYWNDRKIAAEMRYIYDCIISFLKEAQPVYPTITTDRVNGGKKRLDQLSQKKEELLLEFTQLEQENKTANQELVALNDECSQLEAQYKELVAINEKRIESQRPLYVRLVRYFKRK